MMVDLGGPALILQGGAEVLFSRFGMLSQISSSRMS